MNKEIRKGFVGKAVGEFIKIDKMKDRADELNKKNNLFIAKHLTKEEFIEYARQTGEYLIKKDID